VFFALHPAGEGSSTRAFRYNYRFPSIPEKACASHPEGPFFFSAKKMACARRRRRITHPSRSFFRADGFVGERLRWGHEGVRTGVETDPQRPTAGNKRTGVGIGGLTSPRRRTAQERARHVIRDAPRRERDGSLHTSHKTVLRARQAIAAWSECEGAVCREP
jgi:hypothetical protein